MKKIPFWWEEATPDHGERSFDKSSCSVLIVGAGYTGLSAAITLAESGIDNIFVADVLRIGEGASSRNGGQIGNSPKFDLVYAQRKFGDKRGHEIMEDYQAAMPFLLKRAQTLEGNFDLNVNGAVTGAHSRKDVNKLRKICDSLPIGQRDKFEVLGENEVHRVLKTDIYRGALLKHDWGSLHPAKYVRALANRARSLGVRIFTGWRYLSAEKSGSGYRARLQETADTGTFELQTDTIFLAVNGYAGPELSWLRKRTIPVQSYMVATEPLPFDEMEKLIPHNRVAGDTKHILYYFRRSPDGTRMLFGGRARFRTSTEEQSAAGLRQFMAHTFPSLRGARITHSWFGNVCFAYDFVSHVGRMADGIYYSSCCNGNGISMATYLGHRSAEMILGTPGHDRGVVNTHFPQLYFYNGHPWFLPVVGTWYHFLDRSARWHDGK
ncbi:FAD-binding oxidoreductase (plasmid) [Brucella sp. 6810]|uniref:NAD(P)/FAD-dependent oxidoreductase n=1 Tax=Brucella sp. 6810 TaxID=2769351 RepID=UPI00165BC220|nr:FAD-binding oxidoreductase [Brucella sp. 6810]QNQ64460.1 FAD-binding oxidoreductase [Brucella sp. 6810]